MATMQRELTDTRAKLDITEADLSKTHTTLWKIVQVRAELCDTVLLPRALANLTYRGADAAVEAELDKKTMRFLCMRDGKIEASSAQQYRDAQLSSCCAQRFLHIASVGSCAARQAAWHCLPGDIAWGELRRARGFSRVLHYAQ